MEKLSKFWLKWRWYALGAVAALAVAFGLVFKQGKGSPAEKLLKIVFDGQRKLVDGELARKKEAETVVDKRIEEVDKKLEELDRRKSETESKIDAMDLKELADAWKGLKL